MSVAPQPAPFTPDADGVMRVGSTRVTLDTVVAAFREGMTAEGIAEQYPSLRLADVYSAIAYFLNHTAEVDVYLREREQLAAAVRSESEGRTNAIGVRARLLARQAQNRR